MTTTDNTPTSVRIGPFTYSIGPLAPMDGTKHGLFGWHHWPSLEIKYRADVNIQQRAQIILHEILHGIWYTDKIASEDEGSDRDVEESYVEQLAIGLCDFIRNNPDVLAWISQTLAGDGEKRLNSAYPVTHCFVVNDKTNIAYTTNTTNNGRFTPEDILA